MQPGGCTVRAVRTQLADPDLHGCGRQPLWPRQPLRTKTVWSSGSTTYDWMPSFSDSQCYFTTNQVAASDFCLHAGYPNLFQRVCLCELSPPPSSPPVPPSPPMPPSPPSRPPQPPPPLPPDLASGFATASSGCNQGNQVSSVPFYPVLPFPFRLTPPHPPPDQPPPPPFSPLHPERKNRG